MAAENDGKWYTVKRLTEARSQIVAGSLIQAGGLCQMF